MDDHPVSKSARTELVNALRRRYKLASKSEKRIILDEFAKLSGYHRKHAIRILRKPMKELPKLVTTPRRIYDQAVREALVVIWEAADRICGKRLKAITPNLVDAMEQHGHVKLAPEIRKKLLSVSAATMDRALKTTRAKAGIRRKRRSSKKVSKTIPIKTFNDWQDPLPGFLEIDFVVHGGGSMAGEYLHSLVVTDVCSGWTEAVPLLVREQSLVTEGLKRISRQLPVRILGIDSDNDGAFINDTLASYCEREKITFTRSRAHQKNDQAWIEQKNGAVIRRMVGHERFSGIVAGQAFAQLYQVVRLYVNFFQPSFKLRERTRNGAKIKKVYHPPATPCDRLLAHERVPKEVKDALRKKQAQLDPVKLLHRIRQGQAALAALSAGDPSSGPNRQSLDQFLSSLPHFWRDGEVRATHRKHQSRAHDWRTREDPFKDVGAQILLWLQEEPDCTAKSLFERLKETHPGTFSPGQLRTLQRRIAQWRQAMARKLVFGDTDDPIDVEPAIVKNTTKEPELTQPLEAAPQDRFTPRSGQAPPNKTSHESNTEAAFP